MLDNQRFFKVDSGIIFIKVWPLQYWRPFVPHQRSCLIESKSKHVRPVVYPVKPWKRVSSKLLILWTTRLSSHSLGFSKLTVLLWMVAIDCPLHHLLALIFYVVMPSRRLRLSVLSYRNSDRIGLSKGLELAFGSIQLTEELPYQVLCLEYFSTYVYNFFQITLVFTVH